ncbi:MAG: hypothetical protein AMS18_02610 [Gemmatimonas sp. SG8_17]|nr:MAG: hypothetical protein AMS18_02610 [Gemmatimonas sp. SG8_17]
MPVNPVRYGAPDPAEPVVHDLPPIRYGGEEIPLRLQVRRAADGTWRAKLIFGLEESEAAHATAEIFCAQSENDLWQSVSDLRDHHLRDLYRSITE